MDQDKTTVMGGYSSPRTGNGADTTRVVPNPGYAAPDATQASADPTRVVNYGNAPQDPYGVSSQSPYGSAVADPYDDLLQNPIPQPQQTTYMPRTAQPRYESRDRYAREPYREYPKSIPQYGEDEEKKPSRSSSVIKKILIVLAIFFALSVVFAIVSGMLNKRGASTDATTEDGSTPVVDANWVVTSAYYNDNGNLEVQLTRKDSSSGNVSGDQSGADSSSSNTLEDLSNKAQELGDKAQQLGDTAQNLGDTAQNLGDMATNAWDTLQNGISGAQGN